MSQGICVQSDYHHAQLNGVGHKLSPLPVLLPQRLTQVLTYSWRFQLNAHPEYELHICIEEEGAQSTNLRECTF